jgi:hypothetical protein
VKTPPEFFVAEPAVCTRSVCTTSGPKMNPLTMLKQQNKILTIRFKFYQKQLHVCQQT